MSITIHVGNTEGGLFTTNQNAAARHAAEKGNHAKGRSTIFAGDMAVRPDSIMLKKQEAQKQAMKIVGDTFDVEKKASQSLKDMADQIEELKGQNLENNREIQSINDKRDSLMESYGVTKESAEHSDLELLRKERELVPGEESLTEEEKERLTEIHNAGLTDYQKNMLELDDQEKEYRSRIDENNAGINSLNASLRSAKIDRLKSDPMVKAAKQSEEIMEAANKDMIGALYNEAKEHIEEKMQEEKEKAEKRAEKKEEEEKLEEAKEEREEIQEELLEKAAENDSELDEILDKLKLIDEDLKGVTVDKNL
ncbi:MAG: hypothetical protein NC293_12400 [Roseburia sp.]|nr:hypothetical protein [Roseburia sp.]